MWRGRALAWLPFLALWALASCAGAEPLPPPSRNPTPPPIVLNIGIATSATPLAKIATESYANETERAVIRFIAGNSATLRSDLEAGNLDAILVHHLPADSDLWFNPVALDGLALAVHAENPVEVLSRAEIQAIYNGRVENWSAVSEENMPITLLGREQGAGARTLFNQRIMAEQRPSIHMLVLPDDEGLLAAVAEEPGAIGYTTMAAGREAAGVHLLEVDGVLPTPNSTGTQNYPLTVPIYFVAQEEPAGPDTRGAELRAFLAWLQSPEGQARIGEKYGRVG